MPACRASLWLVLRAPMGGSRRGGNPVGRARASGPVRSLEVATDGDRATVLKYRAWAFVAPELWCLAIPESRTKRGLRAGPHAKRRPIPRTGPVRTTIDRR